MADNSNLRRAFEIMKVLYNETDENHSLDTYEIIDAVEAAGCKRPDRKIIDPHISFLADEMEMGIIKEKSQTNRYSWVDRTFETAELKMLADAVQSSRFISDAKSREIITKLKTLTSRHLAPELDRKIVCHNSFKRSGSKALYSIDTINEAMRLNLRIQFQMADYNIEMKEVLRHNGAIYEISPYALLWHSDYYYVIGRQTDSGLIKQYRIDRMKNTRTVDIKAEPRPADFNLERYSGRVFEMFTGETVSVTLDCANNMMNYLIDRFGREFKVSSVDKATGRFSAEVTLDASPTFYAWVFQFGGAIRIVSPEKIRDEYIDLLKSQL